MGRTHGLSFCLMRGESPSVAVTGAQDDITLIRAQKESASASGSVGKALTNSTLAAGDHDGQIAKR
jgi:hypothetical protein